MPQPVVDALVLLFTLLALASRDEQPEPELMAVKVSHQQSARVLVPQVPRAAASPSEVIERLELV